MRDKQALRAKKETEAALQSSEARNRTIMASALDGIITINQEGRIVEFNPAAEAMFGYVQKEVVGKEMADLIIPPSLRERHRIGFGRYLATGVTSVIGKRIETTAMRADGAEFPIELIVIRFGPEGAPTFTAFIRDITERMLAETTLRQSQELLRGAFDNAAIGMALVAPDGRWLQVNRALCEIVGYSEQELLATNFQAITHPDDLETDLNFVRQVLGGEIRTYQMEKRYIHKLGYVVWILLHVSLVRNDRGTPAYFIAQIKDITERKWAEQALRENEQQIRLFMLATNDCTWNWDMAAGRVARSGFERAFGYAAEEVAPDIDWWVERLHPDDRERVWSTFQDAVASGRATFSYEYRFRRLDGSYAVISDRGYLVRDRQGAVLRALGAMTDISARKRAEEVSRDLYERLQASHNGLRTLSHRLLTVQEEERRHLARELHDEIGQVLTAAKINIQQAMHALDDPIAGTHLVESISLLDYTLQQVRNLALDLRPSLLDNLGLVPTLTWLADRHSQASEIVVQVSAESLDTRPAPGIELACYRVAQEALTNVARHARASQVRIELARSDRELVLLIRDNGIGFDVPTMLSRAAKGESIGLLGMQERVILTGGEMEFISSPGQGTEIRARFPLDASGMSRDTRA